MTRKLAFLTGVAAIVLFWSLAARANLPAILPGPLAVLKALGQLLGDPGFWSGTLGPSLGRATGGLALAFAIGAPLGLAGWRWPVVSALLAPLRSRLPAAAFDDLLAALRLRLGDAAAAQLTAALPQAA